MRKLLLLTAITAGFLSSCSEDDFTTQSTVDVNTIAFATNKAMTSTRSAETITSINLYKPPLGEENKSGQKENEMLLATRLESIKR